MRNWNGRYLDGDRNSPFPFIAYLWGIETWKIFWGLRFYWSFIAYLWGIETSISLSHLFSSQIYSLPMRNWNLLGETDRTRLEYTFIAYLWGIETHAQNSLFRMLSPIYSLPMRNWNFLEAYIVFDWTAFIAYLWGIETDGSVWLMTYNFNL